MKIGFIGGGNMAEAILRGLLSAGLADKQDLIVCDKSDAAREKYIDIKTSRENVDVLSCDYVFLAVKPSVLPCVLEELKNSGKDIEKPVFISIAAGKTVASMREILGKDAKIVRDMPNTPAMVLEGMTVVATKEDNVSQDAFNDVIRFFDAIGKTEVLPEHMINTVTGLSGSSPAYVFMLIEAMADAGVRDGLPRDAACHLAAQAVLGSAKMVLESGKHPGELKDMVCSPNGTTIEAVAELEKRGFRAAVMEAIKKCNDKANRM